MCSTRCPRRRRAFARSREVPVRLPIYRIDKLEFRERPASDKVYRYCLVVIGDAADYVDARLRKSLHDVRQLRMPRHIQLRQHERRARASRDDLRVGCLTGRRSIKQDYVKLLHESLDDEIEYGPPEQFL